MAKNTRLATTVTARYFPSAGAVDAFYLDGRMNGRREEHFADITLDREDRGSFYAVYASSHGSNMPSDGEDGNQALLTKISKDLKENSRANIDGIINELAETAVGVTGRLTLSDTSSIQPYFAGMVVKDGEIAAVTLGRGCAYLYRDDALFPLTQDDLGFEAVDYYGKSLPNMGDFSAGVAGTLRYSNIAQLKANDCIILCNREVLEIIGQKRLLQLLDQAEDQSDAAGMVMGLATHEDSRAALQFMIGFVEDLIPLDRLGRSTLARGFAKLSRETGTNRTQSKLPRTTGRTEFAQAAQTEDLFSAFAPESPRAEALPPTQASKTLSGTAAATAAAVAAGAAYNASEGRGASSTTQTSVPVSDLIADLEADDTDILSTSPSGVQDIVKHIAQKESSGGGKVFDENDLSEQDRQAVAAALQQEGIDLNATFEETEIGAQAALPPMQGAAEKGHELLEETSRRVHQTPVRKKSPGQAAAAKDGNGVRKIAMMVLIGIAVLLLAFVIYLIAFQDSTKGTTVPTLPSNNLSQQTLPTAQATPVVVPSSSATTSKAASSDVKPGGDYTVKGGDTLIGIIQRVYGVSAGEAYDLVDTVVAANDGLNPDNLSIGQVIKLPEIGGGAAEETTTTTTTAG